MLGKILHLHGEFASQRTINGSGPILTRVSIVILPPMALAIWAWAMIPRQAIQTLCRCIDTPQESRHHLLPPLFVCS